MTWAQWVAARLSPDTRFGEGARRIYRRISPRQSRAWIEVMHALAASRKDLRFVQVGSNDAGYGDPLRYHILHHGWRGLMIEPLPHVFDRLRLRYADMPGFRFANVAIDSELGERTFYHLRPSDEPDLPPWYDMLGSFSRDTLLKHQYLLPDFSERIVTTQVACKTFDQVCSEQGIERFDMLNIDTEGYDYEVLKTIDLQRYQPMLVLYENKHLSDSDYHASLEQLHAAGMVTHSDWIDTLAVHWDAFRMHKRLARSWRALRKRTGADYDARHVEYSQRTGGT